VLAQNFKTAQDLGLLPQERDALIAVLGMLERGEIRDGEDGFDMSVFKHECGTPSCICGWAHFVSNGLAFPEVRQPLMQQWKSARELNSRLPKGALELFDIGARLGVVAFAKASEAAIALRSYLTTGEARWKEAMKTA
jgi:hypothetical protein